VSVTRYTLPSHTTTSGTNLDEYFPSGTASGVGINTKGASSVTLITQRTAETGTCTLQAFFEFYYETGSTTSGVWLPLLDLNDATQVQGVVYADGVTDGTTPFHRFTTLREVGALTTLTDNAKAVNTVHKMYHIWIPEIIRIRFRSGGTTVTNTFSAVVNVHTIR